MVYDPNHAAQQQPPGGPYMPPPQPASTQYAQPHGHPPAGQPHGMPSAPPSNVPQHWGAPGASPPGMPPPQGPSRAPVWIGIGAGVLVLTIMAVVVLMATSSSKEPAVPSDDMAATEETPSEGPPAAPDTEDDGSDVHYTRYEDPCDVIDIDSYFGLATGGDATGEDTGTNSSTGEVGTGHCNFTQMQGVGVFVMAEVTMDARTAQDRYDYQKELIEIGDFNAVSPSCVSQWDQFTGTDQIESYPFDVEYKFVALHSNFMIGMTIRLDDGRLPIEEVAEMGCTTIEIFADTYSS